MFDQDSFIPLARGNFVCLAVVGWACCIDGHQPEFVTASFWKRKHCT